MSSIRETRQVDSGREGRNGPEPWFFRHASLRHRVVWRLSRITRGGIRSPLYHASVELARRRDLAEPDEGRVNADELVRTWAMWTVEFYTPDNIRGLYESLDRLKTAGFAGPDREAGTWLRRQRAAAGSSMELYLTSEPRGNWGHGHICPLPDFAEGAQGTILCVTPSLTMLVMYFPLREAERDWFDVGLHRDHPTRITQNPDGSVSRSSPGSELRKQVHSRRKLRLAQFTSWHRTHFPGLLSLHGEPVSVCEMSTVDGVDPHVPRGDGKLLTALDLRWSGTMFEHGGPEGNPPFRFNSFLRADQDLDGMQSLSTTSTGFRAQNIEGFGSGDPAFASRLDQRFRRTFAVAALPRILAYYSRRMARARDSAAAVVGSGRPTTALARVRADTAQCVDASVVARELRNAAVNRMLPEKDMDFTLRLGRNGGEPRELSEVVRESIIRAADDLIADVEALNAGLNVQATLLSAHANLRLQPYIIGLALVSMVAGLIGAIGPVRELLGSAAADRHPRPDHASAKTTGQGFRPTKS